MTYRPRARCKRCGIGRGLAGHLSRSGLCTPCGEQSLADALRDLASKSGPTWQKYREGITDYAARLWGESEIPDTLPAQFDTLPLFEVTSQ